jgi:hypothetical protein
MSCNPVFNYLNANKGKKLSTKTLSKHLGIKRRAVMYYCLRGNVIRRVNGIEVGNLGTKLSVFTVDSVE